MKENTVERVIINDQGEALVPGPQYVHGSPGGDLRPLDEQNENGAPCNITHLVCNGRCAVVPVSDSHRAIVCQRCGLRLMLPNAVVTWADLRKRFIGYSVLSDPHKLHRGL